MKNNILFTPDMLLGDIVSVFPPSTTTFNKLDIDYCCQGLRPLAEALAEKAIEPAGFVADLNSAYLSFAQRQENPVDPNTLSNEALIELILEIHHAPERLLLHDLDELINKILLVHYDHDEVTLKQLHRQYALLKMDLESHFADEERALFPAILAARTPAEHEKVRQLIAQLETEHEAAGEMLKSIKTLTNDYQAPAYACPTVHVTYAKLKALTEDIFLHIHKENSVLFPRFQT